MRMHKVADGAVRAWTLAAVLSFSIGCLWLVPGCPVTPIPPGPECVTDADCTQGFCSGTGDCVACVTDAHCDDGDDCTNDVCDAATCTHTDIAGCPEPPVAKSYVGSETCGGCHAEIFGWFRNSGHPYKINEIVDGQMPTYPFSTIEGALEMVSDDDLPLDDGTPDPGVGTDNTISTPASYEDVSFVIGGFGWKARFIGLDGFIVTGSDVQYNIETQGMVSYHDNEVDKPFNCGNCHTTGWKAYTSEEGDDRNLNRQNDLPGMSGTFAAPGIQCEACHGAGSAHVASLSADDITRIATPRTTEDFLADDMAFGKAAACSDCHTRHAEKDYPTYEGGVGLILASGGLIRHHEQNDEMQGINPDDPEGGPTGPHANLACLACHDPHTTTRYMDISGDPAGMNKPCLECHSTDTYSITTGGMTGLACTDCHMPLLAKSALAHAAVGSGPATGDIKSHIFRIDLSAENQFTDDGGFAYPWVTGEFACKTCHNGVGSFELNFPSAMTIHGG